jgi:hypothetical protein
MKEAADTNAKHVSKRPIAAFHHHLKMLRCGPSERPFAATAKSARGELTDCGQSRLWCLGMLLTQHLFEVAAVCLLRCRAFHQSAHSNPLSDTNLKLPFYCEEI